MLSLKSTLLGSKKLNINNLIPKKEHKDSLLLLTPLNFTFKQINDKILIKFYHK